MSSRQSWRKPKHRPRKTCKRSARGGCVSATLTLLAAPYAISSAKQQELDDLESTWAQRLEQVRA